MATINVALIGHGFMGRAHSNAWRQVGPFFSPRLRPRLRVLCGRSRERAEDAARALGWEQAAADWRAVVERAGVVPMVCHNYRRAPAVMLARRLVEEGRLGAIRHFRGAYLQDWIVDPAFPLVWRLRRESAGSGALGDIGSHTIDLARLLVGEVVEVAGALETFVRERPLPGRPEERGAVTVDDAALALLRFENGALGTLEATRMAPGRRNHLRFELNGSAGSVAFDLKRMNELEVYFHDDPRPVQGFRTVLATDPSHPYVRAWWPPGHILGYEHTFTHTVYDLLEAVADDRLPAPSFHDGARNQRVLAAIEAAARSRSWTPV